MSKSSMASSSSFSCSPLSHDYERPDLESIKALVLAINEYFLEFLGNADLWNSLKSQCISKLNIRNQEFFEFSEHSVLSNLYWGIENIEAAIQANCTGEKTTRLMNSERMLQAPALLDEHGVTAGIQNHYLVCCSYFYLSAVRKLQNDEWQVALHFLQAILVSPRLVRTQLAPELCETLFPSSTVLEMGIMGRKNDNESVTDFLNEANINDAVRDITRRCKHWLMYYQIMLYGATPQWNCSSRSTSSYNGESQRFWQVTNSSNSSNSIEEGHFLQKYKLMQDEKVHPLDPQEYTADDTADKTKTCMEIQELNDNNKSFNQLDQVPKLKIHTEKYTSIKCLQEVLLESQSDTPTSVNSSYSYYLEEDDVEVNIDESTSSIRTAGEDDLQPAVCEQTPQASCLKLDQICTMMVFPHASQQKVQEVDPVNISRLYSGRCPSSISDFDLSILELRNGKSGSFLDCNVEDNSAQRPQWRHKAQVTDQEATTALKNCRLMQRDDHSQNSLNEFCLHSGKDSNIELMTIFEKAISRLCFSEGLAKCEEEYAVEVTSVYKMLDCKKGIKYTILKEIILDQLLTAISNSKGENVLRASISILSTIASINKSAIEDIKKKGLRLCDLATALKQNVHEAAILIYLIEPSPVEIKTLEILPELMEIVCTSNSYKGKPASELLTPPAASLMIIEILVTAFDCDTNNMQLAAISSPHILSRLPDVARDNNLEECISMAKIFIKCMQFDGQCRKQISQLTPLAPFKRLLQSNEKRAKFTALQFFHEILCMPRSSAISLLQRIRKEGSDDIMNLLLQCVQQLQADYQLLAANLLLQLDVLGHSSGKSMFLEEAMQIILKSVASEENSTLQQISTFILANIGGTYSWTGEPYTVALLVKKAGVTSLYHRNMIRNFNCGFYLDLRVLCAGMQKLIHFSEGVRESLRRFSSVTWMAEELHRVADFYLPNKSRISCVHTQILEAKQSKSGAVTALIYYRGLLYSGYSDGSIKVWYIKQQSATLVWDLKEHKKAVTCFSLFEPGESLLSGSADKTIRVWQMVHRKLECIEVIAMKEPIQKIETYGQMIFMITQSHRMKVFDSSRIVREMSKTKRAKCMCAVQGKLYIGCMDSSIQEVATANNKEREIKPPIKSWRIQNKPINSIVVHKDWLYSASSIVEGSKLKEWRTQYKPQMSIVTEKGRNILAIGVVEDFIYLNCNSSTSTLQIWLRGTQKNVGRISAGSRITSLLTANDIVLCGTEKGLIKGWIPL